MKTIIFNLLIIIPGFCFFSCKKYLDYKPDKSMIQPNSLHGLQGVLDFNIVMNQMYPSIGMTSSDDYFLTPSSISSLYPYQLNAYIWETDIYGGFPNDWALCYQPVYSCNMVLNNINLIKRTLQNSGDWDNVKGSALFFRARSFLAAAWNWSKAYDKNTASTDMGIPLRKTDNFDVASVRSNVRETYDQIIADLMESALLLPVKALHVMRPSKSAAYALLARTYLSMREYDSCLKYSDLCLQINNKLIDYNDLKSSELYPVPQFNEEVIFHSVITRFYYNLVVGNIDSALYEQFNDSDLRREIYFKRTIGGYISYRGSYDQSSYPFSGIATDEVYLMRAECNARKGDIGKAMIDLNTLMIKRFSSGKFIPFDASNAADALSIILAERRKELIWRGLRWMDIKRLNKEKAHISIKRVIDSKIHTLEPNDNRFALPLPIDLILRTGLAQNPR